MSFSPGDAAFEGFRLMRRNPLALVVWSAIYAVYTLGSLFAMGGMMGGLQAWVEQLEALEAGPEPTSPAALMPIMESYFTAMAHMVWLIPVSMLITALLSAAVARGVVTPQAKAFGYVRLGMDELRVFVVSLVIGILMGIIAIVAFLAAIIVGGLAVRALEGWGGLVMFLTICAAIAFIIWLAVRWSLAVPITVAEKRIAIFDSFGMTKGRFWPLLGMAVIAGIMGIVVSFLGGIIMFPLNMMAGIGMWGMSDDPTAVFEAFSINNPWMVATQVVNAVMCALTVGVIQAPFAAAYKAFKGD